MQLKHLQFVGPVVFFVVAFALLAGGVLAPADALTDDGEPLSPFLYMMGAIFMGTGAVWLVFALAFSVYLDKKKTERAAHRARLQAQGIKMDARVISCESTGYGDFNNQVWAVIAFVIELPGFAPLEIQKHVALPPETIARGRDHKLVAIYVDPRDPKDWVFAEGV